MFEAWSGKHYEECLSVSLPASYVKQIIKDYYVRQFMNYIRFSGPLWTNVYSRIKVKKMKKARVELNLIILVQLLISVCG